MYVITVEFAVKSGCEESFIARVKKQAEDSLNLETACRYFDVCLPEDNRSSVFLYEIYDDKTAFEQHLNTQHFLNFAEETADWVESKDVQAWQRVS